MTAGSIGVIADDVTGACDVAAELREIGLEVDLLLGVPDPQSPPDDADAVVIGLRTRTAPREVAVTDSLAAAQWLVAQGISRWYQKYCSTFDSTAEGMIGPVAEALMAAGGFTASIGTPCTPHADRTVYRGHLFVGDRLLSESSLAHHPLTPMTDPDLVRVLGRQTTLPVGLIRHDVVAAGATAVARAMRDTQTPHVLVDALDDADLDTIAAALQSLGPRLIGGGAGLVTAIGRRMPRSARAQGPAAAAVDGRRLVVVGSASERTRAQVARAGGVTVATDALQGAADPEAEADRAAALLDEFWARHPHDMAVVSASHDEDALLDAQQRLGSERAAAVVEDVLARIALVAVAEHGARELLIAGGETSGAVMRALGVDRLRLTRRVDPGVAWAVGVAQVLRDQPTVKVMLKSGNFGGEDLFVRAWERTPDESR
jgi:uncharacterized protein YgbK (DUF1537 family)